MDEIVSNRPNDQLENAEHQVKTYIQLLERKLKNCISLSNLNKDIEKKYLDLQDELKIQKRNKLQQDEIQKQLMMANGILGMKNKEQQQQIIRLQNEIEALNSKGTIATSNTNHIHQPQLNNVASDDPAANSVLVKGFVEQQLNAIPKISIINLGRDMNIKLMERDIIKVSIMERKFYERHNIKPNKLILIVQLRTPELKVEFLKNKEKLKQQQNLEDIEIIDYVSDDVYNLYQYAKILKGCGYAQIYWRNNSVYAKKTRSTLCEPILITSKDDVDALKIAKRK